MPNLVKDLEVWVNWTNWSKMRTWISLIKIFYKRHRNTSVKFSRKFRRWRKIKWSHNWKVSRLRYRIRDWWLLLAYRHVIEDGSSWGIIMRNWRKSRSSSRIRAHLEAHHSNKIIKLSMLVLPSTPRIWRTTTSKTSPRATPTICTTWSSIRMP